MSLGYRVIFNTQGKNVISKANINSVVYFVNWASFLPQDYKRFRCQFTFKSESYLGDLTNTGFVNMNLGRMNVYDGQTNSSNIGVIYPNYNYGTGVSSYYTANINDNCDIYCDYPSNSSVTITLKTFSGFNNMANMQDYVLTLLLIPID